ncbi:L-tyrosine 3-hydroxylase [Micromonospora orduensis]|uniref:L-tyrosine 3-hydroxylase n=2 Tax=Micromonospora orduensis TaxID=1420891 RepID=A0A5C4QEX7_9ACTN|nr:L-tyrosine 3-hydroxylase [Micromonospora orduensis]
MFWFRWITGHQATFLLWQVLAAILDDAEAPASYAEKLAAQARLLVCGYTLMLIYSSSPTREIYNRVIRGPMARQHVNLSGAWARDYLPVRQLVRGKVSFGSGVEADALRRECELNEIVHQGIADKVVPSGVSLLQGPKPAGGRWRMHRDTLLWLYDGIFLTSRTVVSYEQVVIQLVRRLHAIVLDVMVNGLYPSFASSRHEEPPSLQIGELMGRKQEFTDTLLEIVRFVGALVPEEPQHPAAS